jgi:hypothetical protein
VIKRGIGSLLVNRESPIESGGNIESCLPHIVNTILAEVIKSLVLLLV